jgi:hypothetical protein
MERMPKHHILYPPQSAGNGDRQRKPKQPQSPAATPGKLDSGKSPKQAAGVRLTPLYLLLLKELYATGYMRSDQIDQMLRLIAQREQLSLPAKALRRVVQKKLRALVQAGLLQRIIPPVVPASRSGPPHYIYTLTKHSAAFIAEDLGMTVRELGWRPPGDASFLFLHHVLALVDHKLLLLHACATQQVSLVEWIDDRLLKKAPARVTLTGEAGERIQVSVIPDAVYRLRLPSGHQLACCLEIDRGTSTVAASAWQVKSWRRKIMAYQALQAQGLEGSSWATPGFVVTTVTTSPTRLQHLQGVCEAAGGSHHFWFTTFDRLQADTVLHAPVWQVAGKGTQLHSLLPR